VGDTINISLFECVLFDFDDTLVMSGDIHEAAYRSVLELIGSSTEFDYASFRGVETCKVFERLGFTSLESQILSKLKSARYADIAQKQLRGSPCVRDIVDFLLSAGKRIGIVSNGSERSIHLGLRLIGLSNSFEVVISRDHVAEGKPNPEGILMAIRHFDCLGGNTLFIDDSVSGIQAANCAGVRSVKIGTIEKSATYNFENMCDLLIEFRSGR
jgi:HAD superfamily hydrolase (TIGR01509 family)